MCAIWKNEFFLVFCFEGNSWSLLRGDKWDFQEFKGFLCENWIMGLYLDIFELLCVILPLGLFIRMALSWSEFACETGSKCDFQECGFF